MSLSVLTLLVWLTFYGGIDADWKSDVVGKINALRAAHGASPVTWDATLESYATTWVTHLANQNTGLVHSGGKYGENLAAYGGGCPGGPNNCTWASIDLWYAEGANYDYSVSFQSQALHFTQVVWASTTKIGAAAVASTTKPIWFYIAMEFDPPGNYIGQFTLNVFPVKTVLSPPPPITMSPPSPPPPSTFLLPPPLSTVQPPSVALPYPPPIKKPNSATPSTNTTPLFVLVAATLFVVVVVNPHQIAVLMNQ
jgi:hypothetical protein